MKKKFVKRFLAHKRVRAKVSGTSICPRLSVFRSNKHIFLQLIDDEAGKTIIGLSDKKIKPKKGAKKSDFAYEVGKLIAEQAIEKGIKKTVFDRGGYRYHGRVRRAAEGARDGGLSF